MPNCVTGGVAHGLLSSLNGVLSDCRHFANSRNGQLDSTKIQAHTEEEPHSHTTGHKGFGIASSQPEQILPTASTLVMPTRPVGDNNFMLLVPIFQPVSQLQLPDWAARVLNITPPIKSPLETQTVSTNEASVTQRAGLRSAGGKSQPVSHYYRGGRGITDYKHTNSVTQQQTVSPNLRQQNEAYMIQKVGNIDGNSQSASQYFGSITGCRNTQQQTASTNIWRKNEANMTSQVCRGNTGKDCQSALRYFGGGGYINSNSITQKQVVLPGICRGEGADQNAGQGSTKVNSQSALQYYRGGRNEDVAAYMNTNNITRQQAVSLSMSQQNEAYMTQKVGQGYTERKFRHYGRMASIAGYKNTITQQQTLSSNIWMKDEVNMTQQIGQRSTEGHFLSASQYYESSAGSVTGYRNTHQQTVSPNIWRKIVANMTHRVGCRNTAEGNIQPAVHCHGSGSNPSIASCINTNTVQHDIVPCWILDPQKSQINPKSKAQSRSRKREKPKVNETKDSTFPWCNNGGSRPYQCLKCGKTYKRKHHVTQHYRSQHNGVVGSDKCKKIVCEICGELLSKRSASSHMRIHTDERKFKCPLCDEEFKNISHLARHTRKHIGTTVKQTCQVCGKSFSSKGSLKAHTRIHTSERFQCPLCDKTYKSKSCLNYHIKTHSGNAVKYRCEICDKLLSTKASLNMHTRIHFSERGFKCELCDKSYTQKHVLLDHMRVHTGEKRHCCGICDKSFTYYSSKKIHMRVHANPEQKNVDCGVCGKTFTSKSSLRIHVFLHGEKKFKCPVCGKLFITNGHLSRHSVVHTGEKKYKCEICGISFAYNSSLSIHKHVHSQVVL